MGKTKDALKAEQSENVKLRIALEDKENTIQALVTDIADALGNLNDYEDENRGLPAQVGEAYLTLEKAIIPLKEKYLVPYKDGQATGF